MRLAIAAGVLLGSAFAYNQTRLPARAPVPLAKRSQAVPFQSGGPGSATSPQSVQILWQGGSYSVSPYASPIPMYMQGGQILNANGTISNVGGD
jgi:hypothetical protein